MRQAILARLSRTGRVTSGQLSRDLSLTRQALHRHLSRAVSEGWLVREGRGRATSYRAASSEGFERSFEIHPGFVEDQALAELVAWMDDQGLERSRAAEGVLSYGVTGLVNNAIDHSGAASVRLRADSEPGRLHLVVEDEGVGVFENLRDRLELEDHLHALGELSKGRTTTQPDRHSGEGLFFTSKLVRRFRLVANGLVWHVEGGGAGEDSGEEAVLEADSSRGTLVELAVELDSKRSPQEVFEVYTTDFQFDTTRTVVCLFEYGVEFVSRSEAKRLLANLERFRVVILDFQGVRGVGQGFTDEVFRVWARQHPEVELVPRAMNGPVEFMVRRALDRASSGP